MTSAIKIANQAFSVLASSITNVATSLTVTTGEGAKFPALSGGDYFPATISNATTYEIVKVTARSGDTFTIVRAQEGTTGAAFSAGDVVELRLTAGVMFDPTIARGPSFSVYLNTTQSVPTSTNTKVNLNAAAWDTHSAFDITTNYRFQPTVPGIYQFNGSVWLQSLASSAGILRVYIGKNGSIYKAGNYGYNPSGSQATANISCQVQLNGSTDYVEMICFQNAGVSENLVGNATGVAGADVFLDGFFVRSLP